MKIFRIIKIFSLILSSVYAEDQFSLPVSQDASSFDREVVKYISSIAENQVNVDRDKPEVRTAIMEDKRDWEAALAEVIGNSARFPPLSAEVALSVVKLRNTGNDPRVSDATVNFIRHTVKEATSRVRNGNENQIRVVGAKTEVVSAISKAVGTESSDVLQAILEYLDSPEAEQLEILQGAAPRYIYPSLIKYGNLRNAEEALKVANKLEAIGQNHFVSDIRRAAERIKRNSALNSAVSSSSDASVERSEFGNRETSGYGAGKNFRWLWVSAGAVLLLAFAAYFRIKRSRA